MINDTSYQVIFENNKRWVEEKKRQDPHYFDKLAETQMPEYLYIGCSDSRVAAEELMGLEPGKVFIHRNVANLVNGIDMNASSAIQYAVTHLKVKHIIVCGHYNCGGVRAAMLPQDYGLMNPWLRGIRDVYRIHQEELDKITNEEKRYNRLVELNIQEQCLNVIKMPCVQERYLEGGLPMVHGWVFDLHTGRLKDLNIDLTSIVNDIHKIYDLTDSQWAVNEHIDNTKQVANG